MPSKMPPVGVQPEQRLTSGEAKTAATDKAARAIVDAEATKREAKSDRLRKARLAKEAAEAEQDAATSGNSAGSAKTTGRKGKRRA